MGNINTNTIISITAIIACTTTSVGAFIPLRAQTSAHLHRTASEPIDDVQDTIDTTKDAATIESVSASNSIAMIDTEQDYYDHISYLSYLLEATNWELVQIKQLIKRIKQLEIEDPNLVRLPDDDDTNGDATGFNSALKKALTDAKAAVEVYGATSVEAKRAWNRLDSCFGMNENGILDFKEECTLIDDGDDGGNGGNGTANSTKTYRYSSAALKAHHVYDAAIDLTLLNEALEALGMLKGFTKFVNVEKGRLDRELKRGNKKGSGGGGAGAGGHLAQLQQMLDEGKKKDQ